MKNIIIAGVVAALISAATAAAATTLVITSGQIKNGTIKLVDISAGARRALKGNRGPRGPQGAQGLQGVQGNPGAQGPPGIQRLVSVEATDSIAPNQIKTVVAYCPAGMRPVSGGYSYVADGYVFINNSAGSGWWVSIDTFGGGFGGTFTAHAYCSPNITASASVMIRAELGRVVDAQRESH